MGISDPSQNKGRFLIYHGHHGQELEAGRTKDSIKAVVLLALDWPLVPGSFQIFGETRLAAFGQEKKRLLIEDMNRICVRVDDDHVSVSEFNLVQEEHRILGLLQYDIEVPCVWHWSCGFFGPLEYE